MTFRTKQDKINRKEANRRYYKLEENKQQKRDYMKEYAKRDYVKTKAKEYYINNKLKWGGKREEKIIYRHHEKWARDNGYRDNDVLNTKNTVGFKDGAER
jgi:hypothetical protein